MICLIFLLKIVFFSQAKRKT